MPYFALIIMFYHVKIAFYHSIDVKTSLQHGSMKILKKEAFELVS